MAVKYTPTQLRILSILSDGQRHSKEEIRLAIDYLAEDQTIWAQISLLRKVLPVGEEIVCESFRRKTHYRHVRLLKK